MKQKGFIPILILILLVVLGVVLYNLLPFNPFLVIRYKLFPGTYQPVLPNGQNSVYASPNPTENWKTYTNDKYNYSFKYPPNLKILGVESGLGLTDITKESEGVDLDNSNVQISVKGVVLTKDFIAQEKQKNRIQSKVVINGIESITFKSNSSKSYLLPHPDKEHTVIIRTRGNYDQILSTFKFTN